MQIINLKDIKYEELDILEIEDIQSETMDIEVEKDHYYILDNGLVSHNSISLLTQTTSGLECVFMPVYKRNRKINPNDIGAVVSYMDERGDSWEQFNVFHPKFLKWLKVSGYNVEEVKEYNDDKIKEVIEKSPYYKSTSADVDWVAKVKMQGIVQKWIDHSISVTCNLPESATEEMVNSVYRTAWESGCKGMTVYREGSRRGVLVSKKSEKKGIIKTEAPKRPKALECDIHHVTAIGNQWVVIIGKMEGDPYEVFAFKETAISLSKSIISGKLVKVKSGYYTLEIGNDASLNNICQLFGRDEEEALTRIISTALRHGTDVKYVVQQLNKADGSIVSFSKAIARTLKKYAKDIESEESRKCPSCGDPDGLIFSEGCVKCKSCNFGKCG